MIRIGNHDKVTVKSGSALKYFESVERLQYIKDGEYNVILCHFPLATWNAIRRGSYHIYGHVLFIRWSYVCMRFRK